LVVIAAKTKELSAPATFAFLAQPGLEKATDVVSRAPALQHSFDSALGRLFRTAAFADGKARAMEPEAVREYAFEIFSYQMSPQKRPREQENKPSG